MSISAAKAELVRGSLSLRAIGWSGTKRARIIVAVYAVGAAAWIYLSEDILQLVIADPQQRQQWSVFKGMSFVTVTSVLLWFLLRRTFRMIAASQLSLKEESARARESEALLLRVVNSTLDAILAADGSGRIVHFNGAAEKLFRCSAEEARGLPLHRFIPKGVDQLSGAVAVAPAARADGTEFPAEISGSGIRAGGEGLFTVVVRDISIRVLQEDEIKRLTRLYAALAQINHAIVRADSREVLLNQICEVLVNHGGFRFAAVEWWEEEAQRLVPAARSGQRHVPGISDSEASEDAEVDRELAARVRQERRAWICHEVAHDPSVMSRRETLLKSGVKSFAVLPVVVQERACGTLGVYAGQSGGFHDKEITLLTEAANEISFALENLLADEERKRAEEAVRQERLFSTATLESMPGILYFYDEKGNFLRWNQNFQRMSGYSEEELRGMTPLDFFSDEETGVVKTKIGEVFSGGRSSVEASFISKDGTATPHFFTGERIAINGHPCLIGVGIDISERKRAEIALRELNETLESKVAERTRELQAALVRTESADRVKSAFLATMSHELRTPLNSILGFTGIVLQGLAGPLTDEQAKQLGMVRGSARHLLELINDVLDISKIEAGQLEVKATTFSVGESVNRVMNLVRPLAEKKGIVLKMDSSLPEVSMVTDRRRIEQVLINLLNNAIKFTDHGEVTLTVKVRPSELLDAGRKSADAVSFAVRDTGIGIRGEDLDAIFLPFRQIDAGLARLHEGTGLGLAICRRLVGLLGGDIVVESELNRGSVFTVTLPMQLNLPAA
jgi:PAS domain S-box-containing protein